MSTVLAFGGSLALWAQTPATVSDLDRWTTAVEAHRAGTIEKDALEIAQWPWTRLRPVLDRVREDAETGTLLRAATMYLDIAVAIPIDKRPTYPTAGQGYLTQDGTPVGPARRDPHLWWGRSLVAAAVERPKVGADARATAVGWFHTVTAMHAANLDLAELQPHLEVAQRLFRNDPTVLFDVACRDETSASPLIRASVQASLRGTPLTLYERLTSPRSMIPLHVVEGRFRAVLQRDPASIEARVRLARVLSLRGKMNEAIGLLRAATDAQDPVVRYYAWLFLGDALTEVQDYDDALQAFAEASALFGRAVSPHLGTSRVHSIRGDLRAARAALEPLLALRAVPDVDDDPRWRYDRCAGRDAKAVYDGFAERMTSMPR